MGKTHLITFVLDETSSMMGRKDATISGFNEWMMELEQFLGEVLFTMVKFNTNKHELVYKQAVLGSDEIRLSEDNYRPTAATPLYDAIGRAIRETEDILSERDDEPSVTLVILTDGEENSSTEWTIETVKQLIQEKEEAGWTITYMGVSQEAWQGGFKLGISPGNTMSVKGDAASVISSYAANAQAVTQHLRSGGVQSSSLYAGVTDDDGMLNVAVEDEEENEE